MSYYLTAHRYGNRFNIPIEEKHIYQTGGLYYYTGDLNNVAGTSVVLNGNASIRNNLIVTKKVYSDIMMASGSGAISKTNESHQVSLNCTSTQIRLFYRPLNLKITQGTGPQQRIGDKVFLKSVKIVMNLSLLESSLIGLNGNDEEQNHLTTSYPVSYASISQVTNVGLINSAVDSNVISVYNNKRLNNKLFYKFRLMIVRFNDFNFKQSDTEANLKTYISNWFNTIFLPQAIINASSGSNFVDIPVVSNQSKMLRESTPYNGKYQILYDNLIELNEKDSSKHIEIDLEPKKNLTFNSDDHPTDEDFNNVVGFILPPLYYKTDLDLVTFCSINDIVDTDTATIGEFTTNIKYTYYDV